jgi:hypothetical protein
VGVAIAVPVVSSASSASLLFSLSFASSTSCVVL